MYFKHNRKGGNDMMSDKTKLDNEAKQKLGVISAELNDLANDFNDFYLKFVGDEFHEPVTSEFTAEDVKRYIEFAVRVKNIEVAMHDSEFNKYL